MSTVNYTQCVHIASDFHRTSIGVTNERPWVIIEMLHVTLDSRYIATLSSLLMLAYFFPHQSSSLSLGITSPLIP